MSISQQRGKGWLKDLPDFRDQTPKSKSITNGQLQRGVKKPASELLSRLKSKTKKNTQKRVDLRQWCSPIEDQGNLGSCTAHSAVSLYEYYERKAFGRYINGSRLFLYKVTRNLLGFEGDDGAYIRSAMGAMALFGVVPEKFWPYDVGKYNEEPSAFLYSYAKNYQALVYYRLDVNGVSRNTLLNDIKTNLANSLPIMFGFTCYSSLYEADDGNIPFPSSVEEVVGGHAVLAVGYDDNKKIVNPSNGENTVGAFLIQNSWGTSWGEGGFGYLPYEYVLQGIAEDWWSMTKGEWVESGQFF